MAALVDASPGVADVLPGHQESDESLQNAIAPAPFVTLSLGASEEILLGTLDLQQVLNDQNVDFRPGLLSKANGGVLNVDEVNLSDSLWIPGGYPELPIDELGSMRESSS